MSFFVNLPQSRGALFGEQLGQAIGGGFNQGIGMRLQNMLKQKQDSQNTLSNISQTLEELESLVPESGIGLVGQINPSSSARFNRGKFDTLSSDLLSYYKSLFPRGITQEEFKRIQKDYIPKSNDTEATIRGKLEGFRDLIQKKLSSDEKKPSENSNKKIKFDISNPEHKSKRDEALKRAKGNREQALKLLLREFDE